MRATLNAACCCVRAVPCRSSGLGRWTRTLVVHIFHAHPDQADPLVRPRRVDGLLRPRGDARRDLARLGPDDARRAMAEQDLADSLERQRDLEAARPWIPSHAPVRVREREQATHRSTVRVRRHAESLSARKVMRIDAVFHGCPIVRQCSFQRHKTG